MVLSEIIRRRRVSTIPIEHIFPIMGGGRNINGGIRKLLSVGNEEGGACLVGTEVEVLRRADLAAVCVIGNRVQHGTNAWIG